MWGRGGGSWGRGSNSGRQWSGSAFHLFGIGIIYLREPAQGSQNIHGFWVGAGR